MQVAECARTLNQLPSSSALGARPAMGCGASSAKVTPSKVRLTIGTQTPEVTAACVAEACRAFGEALFLK